MIRNEGLGEKANPRSERMKIIEYDVKYKRQLYDLINQHNKFVPPYVEMSDTEITAILQQPCHYNDLRYPSDGGTTKIYLMVRDDVITCAAQIAFPEQDAYFYWFVVNPAYLDSQDIDMFIAKMKDLCLQNGCQTLGFNRNTFGTGWAGLPDCWEALLENVSSLGFNADDLWEIYWMDGSLPALGNLPIVSVEFEYENPQTIEAGFFIESTKIGEASIWLPSRLSESLNSVGIANLEYFEIYKKHRQKKFGQAALTAIMNKLNKIGFSKLMFWTELDNIAMQQLGIKMGFVKGPVLHWLLCEL